MSALLTAVFLSVFLCMCVQLYVCTICSIVYRVDMVDDMIPLFILDKDISEDGDKT